MKLANGLIARIMLCAALFTMQGAIASTPVVSPDEERQAELIHLLKQDCGSCHGMTLKGGLGPALLPQNLSDKPDYILIGTILYGRETLAMPAWDGILTRSEVEWLVKKLKDGTALTSSDSENDGER